MSDLVGNPEDRFSLDSAKMGLVMRKSAYEPVKLLKVAKGMKFGIQKLETLYLISSEKQRCCSYRLCS